MMDPMKALADIWDIVHTPTSKTSYKNAGDHFSADFDAIRARIRPFIAAGFLNINTGFLDTKKDGSDRSTETGPRG